MNKLQSSAARAFPWFLLVWILMFLAACAQGPDQDNRPRMNRLDLLTDVDMIVRCTDTSALLSAIEDSPLGHFWNSPEMEGFRNDRDIWQELRLALVDGTEEDNAAKIRDIYLEEIKMLSGEVIMGLDFTDYAEQPAVTILAALDETDYKRSLEMDALLFELEDVETIKAGEDFRGTTLYTYIRKEAKGDRFLYQAYLEGTLLVSEDRAWLERALLQLKETPAREPEGAPELTLTAKARLMDRLQSLLAAKAAEDGSPVDPLTLIRSLGLDAVGDVHFNLCMKKDRADIAFQVARRGEWNRGLMVLIPPEPAPVDFRLAHVPRDVASYQVARLDLNAFWMQVPEVLRQISPEFQLQFNMGVNAAGGMMDIDINEDLFNNLDRLVFSYTCLEDEGQQFLYGLKVKDSDAMERTLSKLFAGHSPIVAQLGDFYRQTDIQGHVIHIIQFPMPAVEGGLPVYSEVGLTVADRALIIGQGNLLVDYVQAAVNNPVAPEFYERPAFKEMMARIPGNACGYGINDLSAYARFYVNQVRTALEQAREGEATPASSSGDAADPLAEFLEGFDIDQLPSAEVIASYFGVSEGYSVMDEAGFRSTMTMRYPSH
jgi:hypothetical protein